MKMRAVVARHRLVLGAGLALGVVGAAVTLAQPLVISWLIRAVTLGDPLVMPITLIAALFVADALVGAAHYYLIGRAGEGVVLDLRTTLTGRLLGSKVEAFRRLEHGDVFTRLIADTSLARIALSSSVAQLLTSGLLVLGCVVAMIWIDWRLSLLAGACLGVASAAALFIARGVRRAAAVNREDTSHLGSVLSRFLTSFTTVKASRAEAREALRVDGAANAARTSGIRVVAFSALMMPTMNVGTQVSLAVVITWGMARTATGSLPVEDLTAFIMYLFYLVSPMVMLFMSLGELQQGRAAIDRVVDLATIEQEPDPVPSTSRTDLSGHDAGPRAVEFDSVSFTYPGATTRALDDVSFSVPAVGVTAIVGPSGAGKSTLFHLIERFYTTTAGAVQVGGRATGEWTLQDLRSRVALVEQDNPLFRGTVRDNLTYARPDATERDISEVLRSAHLAEVVDALPQGLETELGEGGVGLSGGQGQRLAIARALLARPAVLLLDEATSQLDSDSEAALRATVTDISRTCQVLTIAHRISTVTGADRILVMERGRIRATGTHDGLMASDDLYRRLASRQLAPADVGVSE